MFSITKNILFLIKSLIQEKLSMVNNKTTQLSIELQKPKPIYYPGETLVGNIKFNITERLKISEVKCLIDGQAHVHW